MRAEQIIRVPCAPGALQAAVDALPADGSPRTLRLDPGVYREKVYLGRANTTVEGAGADSTVIAWGDGALVLLPDGEKRGTFRTATFFADGDGITLRNLTIRNEAPRAQGQAIALWADGDFFRCEGCRLTSFQDTLFTSPLPEKEIQKNGFVGPKQFAPRRPQRHVYDRCLIEGDVDFIFGGAAAWFQACEIRCRDPRTEAVKPYSAFCTAPSTPAGQRFGYVFSACRFTCEDTVPRAGAFLGRPWRERAKTVLLGCELGAHICPEGWNDWSKPAFHTEGLCAEYGSTGPGAAGPRAPWVRKLTAAEAAEVTLEALLASL